MIKPGCIMKRLLILVILFFIGLTSCSDQLNTNEGEGEIIEPIYSQDLSGDDSDIILMDVPGIEILAKSVLKENGMVDESIDDGFWPDVAMVVNDKKKLNDVVVPSNTPGVEDHRYQWPEIDFEKYSLVICHFFTGYIGYCVSKQYIVKNTLYFEIGYKYEGGLLYTSSTNNYFAALYPKLPDVELEVKRLNKLGLTE